MTDYTPNDFMLFVRDNQKINAIKALRAMTGLGLKESKDMVETLPQFRAVDVPLASAPAYRAAADYIPEPVNSQSAHYIVHSSDGHDDHVASFKNNDWNFDDAMNYAQGRMDNCDEKVTVAKVIATTKRSLQVL